jgi:hypothetical protein
MIEKMVSLAIPLLFLGVVAVACDDDDDDDWIETQVDRNRVLADLNAEESLELCIALEDSKRAAVTLEAQCAFASALLGLVSEEACQLAYEECISPYIEVSLPVCTPEIAANRYIGCELTVAEYLDCVEARLIQAMELASGFTCTSLEFSIPPRPEACALLQQECRSLTPVL